MCHSKDIGLDRPTRFSSSFVRPTVLLDGIRIISNTAYSAYLVIPPIPHIMKYSSEDVRLNSYLNQQHFFDRVTPDEPDRPPNFIFYAVKLPTY